MRLGKNESKTRIGERMMSSPLNGETGFSTAGRLAHTTYGTSALGTNVHFIGDALLPFAVACPATGLL
jgi:hypothetical protein